VRGQVFQFGAQAVGGHQHRADGKHEHHQYVGADVEGLEQGRLHQVGATLSNEDGKQPYGQYQRVQRQHHLHQPHRKAVLAVAQHEAQLRRVDATHQHREEAHPQSVVGKPVGEHHKHGGAARHHPAPEAPVKRLAQEVACTHVIDEAAQHEQLVGKHQAQPGRNEVPRTEEHRGRQPEQGGDSPGPHAPDRGRVVAPHEQQNDGHDGGHEARHGNHGAWVEVRHPSWVVGWRACVSNCFFCPGPV